MERTIESRWSRGRGIDLGEVDRGAFGIVRTIVPLALTSGPPWGISMVTSTAVSRAPNAAPSSSAPPADTLTVRRGDRLAARADRDRELDIEPRALAQVVDAAFAIGGEGDAALLRALGAAVEDDEVALVAKRQLRGAGQQAGCRVARVSWQ